MQVADPAWSVPAITREEAREAHAAIVALEAYLSPAPRSWIAARITALLGHWYVADFPQAVLKAIIDDWVTALSAFPSWAIGNACLEYLQEHDRKPTIAAIAKLCGEATRDAGRELSTIRTLIDPREQDRARRRHDNKKPAPRPTPEDIAHVDEVLRRAGLHREPEPVPDISEKKWTAQEMAAGRRALGIEPELVEEAPE